MKYYVLLPGGTTDQGSRKWDQVAGCWSGDIRKPPQPASHSNRGDGHSWDRCSSSCFLPSSLPIICTLLHTFLPHQEAPEWLSVQTGWQGAEAHQEVTIEGCKKGELRSSDHAIKKKKNMCKQISGCESYVLTVSLNSFMATTWTCFVAVMSV